MTDLHKTLLDYDIEMLAIIAHRWDVDLETRHAEEAAGKLATAMLIPEVAEHEWSRLSDRERGALQLLLSSEGHKMPLAQFERLYGEIRRMGPDKREREKPHLSPVGVAEVLYYRGLLALAYDRSHTGTQTFVYVPADLADILPAHQTGYKLEDDEPILEPAAARNSGEPQNVRRATTRLLDDLTTLLAYLQIEQVSLENHRLNSFHRQAIEGHLLDNATVPRMGLLVGLLQTLGLAAETNGVFKPIPPAARTWLEHSRSQQVQTLVQAWHTSTAFNELHYVPDIMLELSGWQNDPRLMRQTLQASLEMIPESDWFSIQQIVDFIKEQEPDFQRPGGDYESWYIRDAHTEDYLKGFESWNRVDGAMLKLAFAGPMHWLGLVDLAEFQNQTIARLTAYGRAYAEMTDWPERPDDDHHLTVLDNGTIQAPRAMNRYDRFQLARFADWVTPGDTFDYHLSLSAFQRAHAGGINAEHIIAFLKRTTGDKLSEKIIERLHQWEKTEGVEASLSQPFVLQVGTPELIDTILNTPELRRCVGTRLGPRAIIVRDNFWQPLLDELEQRGVVVETTLKN